MSNRKMDADAVKYWTHRIDTPPLFDCPLKRKAFAVGRAGLFDKYGITDTFRSEVARLARNLSYAGCGMTEEDMLKKAGTFNA